MENDRVGPHGPAGHDNLRVRDGHVAQSDTSVTECLAMQILADVYSQSEIAEMFDVSEKSVWRHVNNECTVHSPDGLLKDGAAMTKYECMAARLLDKSGWSYAELKMVFEVREETLSVHLNGECSAHALDPNTIPEFDYDRANSDD